MCSFRRPPGLPIPMNGAAFAFACGLMALTVLAPAVVRGQVSVRPPGGEPSEAAPPSRGDRPSPAAPPSQAAPSSPAAPPSQVTGPTQAAEPSRAAVPSQVAVPYYSAGQFVTGLYRDQMLPLARRFAVDGEALQAALGALCKVDAADSAGATAALERARMTWANALDAWETLSAVAVGPVIERRSLRAIDFQPTRPRLIERAIAAAPVTAVDMERIGTPAKGLPALEWLLWTRPVRPATPACDYATRVGTEIADEAKALRDGFAALAARDWGPSDAEEGSDAAAVAAMGEAVSQWVGGVERLRWQRIERPLREARSRGQPPAFARAASGADRAAWQAGWQGIRSLALEQAAEPVAPGAGLAPLETFLRSRGALDVADRFREGLLDTDRKMAAIDPGDEATLSAATEALERIKRLVEVDAAAALQVRIGFSDADGD